MVKKPKWVAMDVAQLDAEVSARITADCSSRDKESDHSTADACLIDLLKKLGFSKTVKSWNAVAKWYA